ncbi:uncharacterized protein MONBRDRAFT_6574 [Monosiga brevicollis MX1]|uniref:TPR-like protein n=1 Tax=Monosiga brevicollis TaxID=81824 RepID=A9UUA3_MONBE|nr:uncharacterized protein MONBRDRAFT_6574 [Monosiga brevicollis MX1]EDQ91388.1 predicted protein [Monosiga brevicollis MX1]|eukprot:XP_001743810.1 hypothetical protein [Monosiga brevicollis MX1]
MGRKNGSFDFEAAPTAAPPSGGAGDTVDAHSGHFMGRRQGSANLNAALEDKASPHAAGTVAESSQPRTAIAGRKGIYGGIFKSAAQMERDRQRDAREQHPDSGHVSVAVAAHNGANPKRPMPGALSDKERDQRFVALAIVGRRHLRRRQFHQAIPYFRAALQYARTVDARRRLPCYRYLGKCYVAVRQFPNAIKAHERELALAQEVEDAALTARGYGNIGHAFRANRQFNDAITRFEKQLALSEMIHDRPGRVAATENLARSYQEVAAAWLAKGNKKLAQLLSDVPHPSFLPNSSQDYFAKAINYYRVCLRLCSHRRHRNIVMQGRAYGGLGVVYEQLDEYTKAIQAYQHRLKLAEKCNDRAAEGRAWCNMGNAYHALHQDDRAIECYLTDLRIAEDLGDAMSQAITCSNLGHLHKTLGHIEETVAYFERHIAIVSSLNNREGLVYGLLNQGKVLETIGRFDDAVAVFKQLANLAEDMQQDEVMSTALAAIGRVQKKQSQGVHISPRDAVMALMVDAEGETFHPLAKRYAKRICVSDFSLRQAPVGLRGRSNSIAQQTHQLELLASYEDDTNSAAKAKATTLGETNVDAPGQASPSPTSAPSARPGPFARSPKDGAAARPSPFARGSPRPLSASDEAPARPGPFGRKPEAAADATSRPAPFGRGSTSSEASRPESVVVDIDADSPSSGAADLVPTAALGASAESADVDLESPVRRRSQTSGLNLAARLRRRVSNLFVRRDGADLFVPTEARGGVGDDDQFGFDVGNDDEFGFVEAPIDLNALQLMLASLPKKSEGQARSAVDETDLDAIDDFQVNESLDEQDISAQGFEETARSAPFSGSQPDDDAFDHYDGAHEDDEDHVMRGQRLLDAIAQLDDSFGGSSTRASSEQSTRQQRVDNRVSELFDGFGDEEAC